MTSQFAQHAAEKAFRFLGYRFSETETAGIAKQLDVELHEVREVLDGLQTFQMNLGSEGTERHWCQPNGGCNSWCQRARELRKRLEVK
jgi:hypothetical protein